MSPLPNISKLLQIPSALWESTIASIVLENEGKALSCEAAGVLPRCVTWMCGCLTLTGRFHCRTVEVRVESCLRLMLLEMLVLTEIAGRRRHEGRKGKSRGCECCLETRLKPFAVTHACAHLTPTYIVAFGGLVVF